MAATRGHASKKQPITPAVSALANGADVLTLAEAAAYLRVPADQVERLVGPGGLPGRLIGGEWRFLKSALQDWLRAPATPSNKQALLAMAGAFKDDPFLEQIIEEAYQKRGRPITEDGR